MAITDRRNGLAERPVWYARIAGIPHYLASYDLATYWGAPPGGQDVLSAALDPKEIRLPKESVSPGKPIASISGMDLVLHDVDPTRTLASLFAAFNQDADKTYTKTADVPKQSAATNVDVDATAGFDAAGKLYIGNETLSYADTDADTFKLCVRGVYNSQVAKHRLDARFGTMAGVGAPVWSRPYSWFNRKITVWRNWLRPDGTPWDNQWHLDHKDGGHEERMYTGRIRDIKEDTHRQRVFTLLTNPILSDLDRPIASHVAQTELGVFTERPDGTLAHSIQAWSTGISRFAFEIVNALGTRKYFNVDLAVGVLPILDLTNVFLVLDSMVSEFNTIAHDVATWGAGNRPLCDLSADEGAVDGVRTRSLQVRFDRDAGEAGSNGDVVVRLLLDPRTEAQSVGPMIGFPRNIDFHAMPGNNPILSQMEMADIPEASGSHLSFHPRQTRWYVKDHADFTIPTNMPGVDAGIAYVLIESKSKDDDKKNEVVKTLVSVTGKATDASGKDYFTGQIAVSLPPFMAFDNVDLSKHVHYRSLDDDGGEVTARQVLCIRNTTIGDALRMLLMSSGTAQFNDATWDALPSQGMGLDLEAGDILVDSFEELGAFGGGGLRMNLLFTKATTLREWATPHLIASGLFLTMVEGRIALRSWATGGALVRADAPTIDRSVHSGSVSQSLGMSEIINTVSIKLGHNPLTDEWTRRDWNIVGQYTQDDGGTRALDLPLPSLWPDDGGLLPSSLYLMAVWLLSVLGRPLPRVRTEANRKASHLWLGDNVKLTVGGLMNPKTAARSYTDVVFQVVSKDFDQHSGRASLELTTMDGRGEKIGPYAPSGFVTAWDAGNKRLTLSANKYSLPTDSIGGVQTDARLLKRISDADGFPIKCRIHRKGNFGSFDAVEVVAINTATNTVDLDAVPAVAPVSGDRLRLSGYDLASGSKAHEHSFIGDDNGNLGAANDPAFSWSQVGGRV